jgi:uncharacterized protein (TIGR00251 family)
MLVEARVVPNSGATSVSSANGVLKIKVRAKAEDNKANKEALAAIEEQSGGSARIVRGSRSRNKTISIEGDHSRICEWLKGVGYGKNIH